MVAGQSGSNFRAGATIQFVITTNGHGAYLLTCEPTRTTRGRIHIWTRWEFTQDRSGVSLLKVVIEDVAD